MTAAAFLKARGPVCERCGVPAVARIGIDLVEPDSGVRTCEWCAQVVKTALVIMLQGEEKFGQEFMRLGPKKRKERQEEAAKALGWSADAHPGSGG